MLNKELEEISLKMDLLIDGGKVDAIRAYLSEIEDKTFETSILQSRFYYVVGTGYSRLTSDFKDLWAAESLGKSVRFFRRSTYEPGFKELSESAISDVYTNLGFALGRQGRVLESIRQFEKAIEINVNPVALLGRGHELLNLADGVPVVENAMFLQVEAYKILRPLYDARHELLHELDVVRLENNKTIVGFLEWASEKYNLNEDPVLLARSEKKQASKLEINYFKWCARETLFINEVSELEVVSCVVDDSLCFPNTLHNISPIMDHSDTLALSAAFSEIKHQYAFARFNFFDAVNSKHAESEELHFSDQNLFLTNSLDYCVFRRDIEMIKVTFRLLYSCFDKLATLLNNYLMLDLEKRHLVHFSSLWFKPNSKNKQIRDSFIDLGNPFLLALYWLSRDVNDSEEPGHGYWLDDNAEKMADIRNKMEHQGFRVVIDDFFKIVKKHRKDYSEEELELSAKIASLEKSKKNASAKQLEYIEDEIIKLQLFLREKSFLSGYPLIITDVELKEQTLRLMKIVRYAIIYMALAIKFEEDKKSRSGTIVDFDVPIL